MKTILTSVLLTLLLTGCGGEIEPGTRSVAPTLIRGLEWAAVTESSVGGVDSYVATIESRDRAVLTARTDGWVERVEVGEGSTVAAGELLLTIRDNQGGDRLREAEAAVDEARQALAAARSRLLLAQKTEERYQRLYRNQAATAQELDQISAELQLAQQGVQGAQAAVARGQSARDAARTAAAWRQVRAPYAARVVARQVQAGSTVMPGTPLLVLDRSGGWTARGAVPESRAAQLRVGTPVRIEVPAAGRVFPAEVSEILPADPRSRTVQIKAPLPADAELTAGLFARLVFSGSTRQSLQVPASALVQRGQLTGVYLVRDGVLHYRLIKTGRQSDHQIEVLAGLDAGDLIVVSGVERARSGARVED
ncbi:MAG: efflux RND transporter periplasmic adaptor subunit [Desulfuromonadales bacterium]|nr:efflux RND transporter periplasmic adaptor subunit [Desulfuromonadales bacterium]